MGCFTRFSRTWWPGQSADVIDPNKSFDYQRRLNIIKKAVIALVVLALIGGSIYLAVRLSSGGSGIDCPQNATDRVNNSSLLSSVEQPEKLGLQGHAVPETVNGSYTEKPELLLQGSALPGIILGGHTQNKTVEVETTKNITSDINEVHAHAHPVPVPVNATTTTAGPQDNGIELKPEEVHPVSVSSKNVSSSSVKLIKSDEPRAWCASKEHPVECVGLSKNFKTVKTFSDNSSKPLVNTTAEGFVLVKIDDSKVWHPYCYRDWTLEMGYQLCHVLGFNKLMRLNTVELDTLKSRLEKTGTDISLDTVTAVVSGKNSSESHTDSYCTVGSVVCG